MYRIIFIFHLLYSPCLLGQVVNTFDGSQSFPNYWKGDIENFQINSDEQLQLNDDQAGSSTIYFDNAFPAISNLEWQIKVKQSFSGSSNNYSKIYLLADQTSFGDSLNSYYILLGESGSNDAIQLVKQNGTMHNTLVKGNPGQVASSFEIRLKIILDSVGIWSLYVDELAGINFDSIGTSTDTNIVKGNCFGISCNYTSSNATKFYFDDLYLGVPLDGMDPFLDSLVALAESADPTDLIINEVLFNPFPFGADFVEIYNNSDKHINIKNWKLANLDNYNDSISNLKNVCEADHVFPPAKYIVLTKDSANIQFEYANAMDVTFIQMESMPSYNNDDGTVILLNEVSELIDSMSYQQEMQFPLLEESEGVSLERIHFDRPGWDVTNWHSASEGVGFATPGYLNSQFNEHKTTLDIEIAPEIFTPNNDGHDDVVSINYQFAKEGYVGNISLFDSQGRLIRQLINNELLGVSGTFSWDGTDQHNAIAYAGIYIIYFQAYHVDGDVQRSKSVCVLGN